MVAALERDAAAGRITEEEYTGFTSGLARFEIPTMQTRGMGSPSAPRGNGAKNPVGALVGVRIAVNSGDQRKAEEAIAAVSAFYPDNPSVQEAAASYYNETGNYAKAEAAATGAIALDAKSPDAYKARALARASLEDRKGAIEDINKAMAIDPQDESARLLAVLLESRKAVPTLKSISSVDEIRRALGVYDEVPEVVKGEAGAVFPEPGRASALPDPDSARSKAYLKTALAKNRLGDYESAASYAGLAIEKDPGNFDAYLERANANNFLGRYDDAVRDAGFVIGKDPGNLQAFNMRAWALNRKGRARDAETDASRAIGLNPNFADAWFNRALAYEGQGDYGRMLQDFKHAAALNAAYAGRYQDAVAQYGARVPGLSGVPAAFLTGAAAAGEAPPVRRRRNPLRRFLITLFFTLTGGALVAAGLIHVMSSRDEAEAAAKARTTHPDLLSPSIFYEGVATGKYKIERKLGEGAMGVVYEAMDQSLGRRVAIKKMGDEIKVNEREKQRFLEEARTVALLHHPNVVEIHTIFEEDDNIYLVFEHVDGVTLDRVLHKEARLPLEDALRIFAETAGALAYAHSKNVIHRDLKLSNIMLSAEGGIKVMDFGLARRAPGSMARSSSKEVVGSPAYMAPEQELGTASPESDIYSLGVCLYEALSGVLPFPGPDFHYQKTCNSFQRLSDILPGLPGGVDAVVAKCLSPAPEDRFRSAEELRRALNGMA
jgi:tetratricopeptide (TPR) repeat protein/tRNA A-37 threonylcarbamoyl transferase component Bud32